MKQIIMGGNPINTSNSVTQYVSVIGHNSGWTTVQTDAMWPIQGTFTVRNLRVELENAPGAGKSYTFALMAGTSPSLVAVTIADGDTSGEDISNSHTFTDGDDMSLRCVPTGTPVVGDTRWSFEIEGGTAGEAYWGSTANSSLLSSSATRYNSVLATGGTWFGAEVSRTGLVALEATITEVRVELTTAPGSGTSYTFQVRVNGIDAGDSFVISGTSTTGSITGQTIDIVPGDLVGIQCVPSTSPVATTCRWAIVYTPDTDGESNISGYNTGSYDVAATEYQHFFDDPSRSWTATESNKIVLAGGAANAPNWQLKKFRMDIEVAPGSGSSVAFNIRKNQGSANSSVVISGASDTTGVDPSNTDTFTSGDELSLQVVPTTSPAVGDSFWAAVQFIQIVIPDLDFRIDGILLTTQPTRVRDTPVEAGIDRAINGGSVATVRSKGRKVTVTWGEAVAKTAIIAELRTARNSLIKHTIQWTDPSSATHGALNIHWLADPKYVIMPSTLYQAFSVLFFERPE